LTLKALEAAIQAHGGEFTCSQIHGKQRRTVSFQHVITPPTPVEGLPKLGKLRDFYSVFGSVRFYFDEASGESARYLAPVGEWEELGDSFSAWLEDLDEDEREEILPGWVETCLVIGETPSSGNYVLVPTQGPEKGKVFEFDHDGFEFTEEGADVFEYVQKLLKPDSSRLTDMASHMRFAVGDRKVQWWIEELRCNDGHVARTKV
jgi:hypothetical protein